MQIIHNHYSACRWSLNFIKSEFAGQLPRQYSKDEDATKQIPAHMNDMNVEEPTRYVSEPLFTVKIALNNGMIVLKP